MPLDQRQGSFAAKGFDYCNKLFDQERKFADLFPEKRYQKRLEQSLPVVEAFFAWPKSFLDNPKSVLKTAGDYLADQWLWLKNIYLDG